MLEISLPGIFEDQGSGYPLMVSKVTLKRTDPVKILTKGQLESNLMTTHSGTHQWIINSIHKNITSMGMRLKPSKCRSYSVCSGKSKDVPFYIGEKRLPSIKDEDQKFLGKLLFFSNKSTETFKLLESTLKEGMELIDSSSVRNEYKLWIYKEYLLPSKRFLMTVHTLTSTQLSKLNTLTDKFIKSWAGLPRSATNAIIHLQGGLDIRSISEMYTEVHATSHARTRLKGDNIVNHVLDTTLLREADYTRKKCTTSEAELTYMDVLNVNTVDGDIPLYTGDKARQLHNNFSHTVQEQVKKRVRFDSQQKWEDHVKSLTVQGNTLALAAAEKEDAIWKSYMYNLKAGTLKFLLNATIDTLPTAANLLRWKKSPSDLCKLCRGRQTTNHILNICSVGLNTGRWEWRHNCILNYIVSCVNTDRFTVFSDLEGHQVAGGGTIPPEICITAQKPDVVILDKDKGTINIFELTCPLETNIEKRHQDKMNKYSHFLTDCSNYICNLTCFEISSKGFISQRNHTHLKELHRFMKPDVKLNKFKQNISALSVYSSYHIWLCRTDPVFTAPPYLPAPFH